MAESARQYEARILVSLVRVESSDADTKRVEPQSKVMALDVSQDSSGRGSGEQ